MATRTASPNDAASSTLPARAPSPRAATSSDKVSGPREFAIATSCPASTKSRAVVDPMLPPPMIPMRISSSFGGLVVELAVRRWRRTAAVSLRELMDVAGDDAALGAADLTLLRRLTCRRPAGFVHASSFSSLGDLYDGRRTLAAVPWFSNKPEGGVRRHSSGPSDVSERGHKRGTAILYRHRRDVGTRWRPWNCWAHLNPACGGGR